MSPFRQVPDLVHNVGTFQTQGRFLVSHQRVTHSPKKQGCTICRARCGQASSFTYSLVDYTLYMNFGDCEALGKYGCRFCLTALGIAVELEFTTKTIDIRVPTAAGRIFG